MARRFFECYEELFEAKKHSGILSTEEEDLLTKSKEEMEQGRKTFYRNVQVSWDSLINKGTIDVELLEEVSVVSRGLVKNLRRNVSSLYPYGGITAAIFTSEINRIWRNIFTASQHNLLRIG